MMRLICACAVTMAVSGCADDGSGSGIDGNETSAPSTEASGVTGSLTTDVSTSVSSSTTTAPDPTSSGPVETDDEGSATTSGCGTQCEPDEDAIAVAVGYGTRRVMSEDGVEWTGFVELDPQGGDDNNLLRGIGYGDGTFVAVGGAGQGLSLTSFDGVEWVYENREHSSFLSDAVWFDGAFVAAGGNGYRVRSSDHGQTWGDATAYFAGHFRGLAASPNRVVAVGHTYGDDTIGLWSSSTDGIAWSTEQTGGAPLSSVAHGGGVFVAVGDGGRVVHSTDGQMWTDAELGLDETRGVFFADGQFHVASGTNYWMSADGVDWSAMRVGDAPAIAARLDGSFLATSWPAAVLRAQSLGTWETVFQVKGPGLTDIAVGVPQPSIR